ncbi:MAG: NADH-quinone oxidoreductase subunit NuoK [Elusimicrobia bacterium]|nr:NADH-quinone oxidoreductase subunit NuoK [Elusimicrobiota bacterium]
MSALIWAVSGLLFFLGLAAVVLRRQLLAVFLGMELMVVAAALALGHEATRAAAGAEGFVAVLLVLAVAAAEAVVGLTLVLRVHWSGRPAEADSLRELRG